MNDKNLYEARAAIAALPGKSVQPWRDGDAREHCSHCRLCGMCYPTRPDYSNALTHTRRALSVTNRVRVGIKLLECGCSENERGRRQGKFGELVDRARGKALDQVCFYAANTVREPARIFGVLMPWNESDETLRKRAFSRWIEQVRYLHSNNGELPELPEIE